MSAEGLQLTVHLGERDRAGDGFLADAIVDACARHRVHASCLLRGVEGFGAHHRLATERLLTLSEDLPVVCVAAGAPESIEALAHDVHALQPRGLMTVERAQLLGDAVALAAGGGADGGVDELKLSVHLGRRQLAGERPAHLAVVDALHDAGVAGASVLLGVDGTLRGERRRARFAGSNAQVPLMVVSVGARGQIEAALSRLAPLLEQPLATLERVRVCKRDGARLSEPLPAAGGDGRGRLTVYASEQSRHRGAPLHRALVRRLRAEGAAGATALRGIWGYHGGHAPHGDRFWALRRRVPVITTIVDRAPAIARWFEVVDELTDETGLVTSERVPAWPSAVPPPTRRR